MPFTVEDGTGVAGANAYASVAFVDGFWADRGGNTAWDAADNDAKQVGIIRATDYAERRFGSVWRGRRAAAGQSLGWPRTGAKTNDGDVWDDDAMPYQLLNAIAVYAPLALDGDLFDESPTPTTATVADALAQGGQITSIRKKTDVLEKEFTFAQVAGRSTARLGTVALASDASVPEIAAGDLWLEELVRNTQGGLSGVKFGRVARA